jgi:putative transposase
MPGKRNSDKSGISELQDRLPQLKLDHPELKKVYSHLLQNVTRRVELAFKAFFRRVKAGEKPGYPRSKGRGWYDSFTCTESGFKLTGNVLHLSKIGDIRVKLHRELKGKIKRLTIRRSATNKWYVSFLTDNDCKEPLSSSLKVIGVDVGISSFAMLSNGTKIYNRGSSNHPKKHWQKLKGISLGLQKEHHREPEQRKSWPMFTKR